jgi:hypothetical protein
LEGIWKEAMAARPTYDPCICLKGLWEPRNSAISLSRVRAETHMKDLLNSNLVICRYTSLLRLTVDFVEWKFLRVSVDKETRATKELFVIL